MLSTLVESKLAGSILILILSILASRFWIKTGSKSVIPTINAYPGDLNHARARKEFISNAQALLEEGASKYPDKPFRIITALSERIFLPYIWIDWVRKHPDLDHQASVAQDFFGDYPGFEAIGAFNDPNHFVIDLVKKRMSQISQSMLDTFDDHSTKFLEENFGDSTVFNDVSWGTLCFRMTASVASAVFSGPTLAYDQEWQHLLTSHTTSIFNAARALRSWPSYFRPLVHWFLPDCKACRVQLAQTRRKLASYELQDADSDSVLAWTRSNESPDAAVIQLALAAGAIHTSSQLLQQVVLDLALASTETPKIIDDLRKEISVVLSESDDRLVPASISKLVLMDACTKESQRFKPQTLNNLERVALRDVALPDGQTIIRGTQIAVASSPMWSTDVWGSDAGKWNPYRYIDGSITEKMNLVSSNNKHYAFGMGRFVCPGRFFLAAEMKVILCRLLMGWDLRIRSDQPIDNDSTGIKKSGRVPWKSFGFEQLADSDIVIEVRRREQV